MVITLFGLLTAGLAGLFLLLRGPLSLLSLVMALSLLGGAAALNFPALGGSSVSPAVFALLFLVIAVCAPGRMRLQRMSAAMRDNAFLVLFAVYGAFAALTLPRVFAGAVDLTPMRPLISYIFETFPLAFSSQNITTAFYLLGTAAAALAAHVAMKKTGAHKTFVNTALAIAVIHAFLGVSDVLISNAGYSAFLSFFRNANYAQLDHTLRGFARMDGVMPEASLYAGFAIPYFVLMTELWMRRISTALTGAAALLMLGTLIFSLSSTAYVGLAVYACVFGLRSLIVPGAIGARQTVTIAAIAVAGVIAASSMVLLNESLAQDFSAMLAQLTVEKGESQSGRQRMFWAMQGFDAFAASYGLGVGPGSFRSSSIFTAILGSMGVIGIGLFIAYLFKVLKFLRASTYRRDVSEPVAVGAAAGWAAFSVLFAASVSAPSPDPGLTFAIFCGASLSLRAVRKVARASRPESAPMRAAA